MKKISENPLTQSYLKSILNYNPDTGVFTWIKQVSPRIKIGGMAGTKLKSGYVYIRICKKTYLAHRLVFLYITGSWPQDQIDHINHVVGDNRLINLRDCTRSENQWNQKRHKNNKSGFKGVSWAKKRNKWLAQIQHHGKSFHLGYYDHKERASKAYDKAALEIFGEFSCLNERFEANG